MDITKEQRAKKLKKLHLVLGGAGAGTLVSRGLEYITGSYSLLTQLLCIGAGLAIAWLAVRKFCKS